MMTLPANYSCALLLVALSCWSMRAQAQDRVATMKIDGRNGFLNNVQQKPKAKNVPVQDGSTVRTGDQTNAFLDLIPQGQAQVNENSAQLVTNSFFKSTRCAALRLLRGEVFVNGSHICFLTNVGAVSGISRSRIDIKTDERGTVLTVIEGMAELEGSPATMQVLASEQLVVLPNGQYSKQNIGPEEAQRTIEWTKNYFKGMSTAKKVLIGLGVVLGAAAVHEATKDDDDDNDRDPQPPPPAGVPPEPVHTPPVSETPPPRDPATPPSPVGDDVIRAQPERQVKVLCCHQVNGAWVVESVDPMQCNGRIVGRDDFCGKLN